MTIRKVRKEDYHLPMAGDPFLHRNLEWYATEDDKVLGVVVLDLHDRDYSWVVLTENDQGPGFSAVDMDSSVHTQEEATRLLHAAMRIQHHEL